MPHDFTKISPPPLKRRRISPSPPTTAQIASLRPPPARVARKSASANAPCPLRIYSWNINGITPFLPPDTPRITGFFTSGSASSESSGSKPPAQPSLRTCLRRWQWPHVLCLQEVKIAPTDTKTQAAVQRAINAPLDKEGEVDSKKNLYDAHFVLPGDKYNATGFGGKVYGVCTLVRRDLPDTRVLSVDWDLEGRVSLVEIPSLGVVVINVYAVNGTTNDYRDPKTGKVVGVRHDRKKEFHTLLAGEVKRYEEQGWEVVVAGDINISRTKMDSFPQLRMGEEHVKNRADFEEKIVKGLAMIDTFRFQRGDERKFSYRPRNKSWGAGGDRVDMILVTKGLSDNVKEANILDNEEERGPSDHVPLFVKLEVARRHGTDEDQDST
ncbi:hypothetical protein P7C71_g1804, partial [Lecanoromycetidae sp. Uapishka_2]